MAKITRKIMEIFGSTAGPNQLAAIGSLAAGSPFYSTDPAVLQTNNLGNYEGGWFDIVLGLNSPAIEDLNALCYVITYQLAYLFQEGIPEWLNTTYYYTNSFVQYNGIVYQSLTDGNVTNTPSSGSPWNVAWVQNSNLGSNINLLGKAVQEGSKNIVVSNTNATNSLAVIRGRINSAGAGISGEGISSIVHSGTGAYELTYTTPFFDIPAVTGNIEEDSDGLLSVYSSTGSGCVINTTTASSGTPTDLQFSFIIIGERA